MSSIKILELSPLGSEIFQDTESFLDELTDSEIKPIIGGVTVCITDVQTFSGELSSISLCQTVSASASNFD